MYYNRINKWIFKITDVYLIFPLRYALESQLFWNNLELLTHGFRKYFIL